MRAAVYGAGGSKSHELVVKDVPDPKPGWGEVRVRVRVSGVNPTDWKAREWSARNLPWPEQIPNQDGAGEIDAVGEGVDPSRRGQRVWVYHAARQRPNGTAAQYTVVPSAQAVHLPEGISFSQGAGLGIPYLTAHRCLFGDGGVQGRTVLVSGGAGAVGHAAIQLARWAGARVITTVSSEEKARIASDAGAHGVLNYRDADFREKLKAAAPGGIHHVVEVALGANLEAMLPALAPHAVIWTYATEEKDPVLPVRALMTNNLSIRGMLVYGLTAQMLEDGVRDVTAALRAGALEPLPEHRFTLEQTAAALDAVKKNAVGKVLIDIP
ncbi:NADPH:quinone reductase [Vitiosangium sp. GDMCC 1.1324]|uniref:NADPH:quinone reductase n=1 Tax=Vitiosangium sp. (strain GDMCC 1.1324) TaxID=2138576 RepID=UPI000D37258E|nr:NADPH:quinone reductase [Vitiosangium sp. GDMCC 1.1324]PTL83437.1 NADPH:quinone reductase [Vitiosangium sp. GDMCC 1.1324]